MTRFHTSRIAWVAVLAVAAVLSVAAAAAAPAAAATTYTITDLGSLGGGVAHGLAINASGQVTGDSVSSQLIQVPCPPQKYGQPKKCFTHPDDAFVWSNGTMTDLGSNFSPAAVNDSGVIVGGQFVYNGGTLQNLNNLIPAGSGCQIQSATGINDNGQIVANATASGNPYQQHALLLNPR